MTVKELIQFLRTEAPSDAVVVVVGTENGSLLESIEQYKGDGSGGVLYNTPREKLEQEEHNIDTSRRLLIIGNLRP